MFSHRAYTYLSTMIVLYDADSRVGVSLASHLHSLGTQQRIASVIVFDIECRLNLYIFTKLSVIWCILILSRNIT